MSRGESVLAVPTSLLQDIGSFQGLRFTLGAYLQAFAAPGAFSFLPREAAETDEKHKQLVTYVLLTCGDAVFTYRRSGSSSEKRLLGLRSIGVGGHVSSLDSNLFTPTIAAAFQRELFEEVVVDAPFRGRLVALLNDDSTPVGRVHLGLVYLVRLLRPAVKPRERKLAAARFEEVSSLVSSVEAYETWSQLCLASFPRLLAEFETAASPEAEALMLSHPRFHGEPS